jgi:hypothetical protein
MNPVNWRWSHDFEDIIKLLIGNSDWYQLLTEVPYYNEFVGVLSQLIKDEDYFYEACRGQLNTNFYSDNQIQMLIEQIRDLV